MKRAWMVVAAALAVAACSSAGSETEMLKSRLSETQTAVRLSTENAKWLEDIYSDIYLELNNLTVTNFKTKVAAGDTSYTYIGRPSCGDCNAFELMFKCYIEKHRPGSKIYSVNVHRLHQDKEAWIVFRQQHKLSGMPVLAKYSKGRQVNKLGLEDNGGSISVADLEKWLVLNKSQLLSYQKPSERHSRKISSRRYDFRRLFASMLILSK